MITHNGPLGGWNAFCVVDHSFNDLITRTMTISVIYFFEMIYVSDDKRKWSAGAPGPGDFIFGVFQKCPPIGDLG